MLGFDWLVVSDGWKDGWTFALIVSIKSIQWILWFSLRYTAAECREIFGVNAPREKVHQLGSPNLQDIFIGG